MNDFVVSCATSIESMRCSSRVVPSVTDTSACVWPRVNSAEPCVRGSHPTSQVIGRTVSRSRPSTRSPADSTRSRIVLYSISSMTVTISRSLSGNSSASFSTIVCLMALSACVRSAFTANVNASETLSSASSLTRATRSTGGSALTHSILGCCIASTTSSLMSSRSLMPLCATSNALTTSASVSSSAPPSTMTIDSREPETVRSKSENSSCWKVGFRIHAPSTRPTRTAAIGPFQGTLDSDSAADAAVTPSTSASFSWSAEST